MLRLYEDRRIGGSERLYLAEKRDDLMLVPDEVKKCVVFLCCRRANEIVFAGTAFFVGVPASKENLLFYVYLVTAKHVIEGIREKSDDQIALVRINTRDDGSGLIESDVEQWRFHPSDTKADVAAVAWCPDRTKFDYLHIPLTMFASDDVIKQHLIGPGDEVFFPGLFVSHYGRNRNLPLVRIGNIASMSEEPVHTKMYGPMEAYLVEARSIGGLSGSPVFVHLLLGRGEIISVGGPKFFLLGLMHGHYDSPLTDADEVFSDEARRERVNMGIAVVAPSRKIAETLNQPHFASLREKAEEQRRRDASPTPD